MSTSVLGCATLSALAFIALLVQAVRLTAVLANMAASSIAILGIQLTRQDTRGI